MHTQGLLFTKKKEMLKIVLKISHQRRIIKHISPLKSVKISAQWDTLSNEWS